MWLLLEENAINDIIVIIGGEGDDPAWTGGVGGVWDREGRSSLSWPRWPSSSGTTVARWQGTNINTVTGKVWCIICISVISVISEIDISVIMCIIML